MLGRSCGVLTPFEREGKGLLSQEPMPEREERSPSPPPWKKEGLSLLQEKAWVKAATYYSSVLFPGGGGGGGGASVAVKSKRGVRGGGSRTRLLPISLLRTARSTTTLSGGRKGVWSLFGLSFPLGTRAKDGGGGGGGYAEGRKQGVHACWVQIKEEILPMF